VLLSGKGIGTWGQNKWAAGRILQGGVAVRKRFPRQARGTVAATVLLVIMNGDAKEELRRGGGCWFSLKLVIAGLKYHNFGQLGESRKKKKDYQLLTD